MAIAPRTPNGTSSRLVRDVIGRKNDTAAEQVSDTASLMAYMKGMVGGARNAPTTDWYVDVTNGSDSNDGLSWAGAKATIGAAMTLAAALGTRGRARIFVAPGGYEEDIVTPLNTECPFGQLIGVNPTSRSFGAAYLFASTAATPTLTIRARGWQFDGFEIGAVANGGCVWLDGSTASSNPGGTELRNCIISGWGAAATYGIDVTGNGAPLSILHNIHFNGMVGAAIKCTESGTDQPRFWDVGHCTFVDNGDHIAMNPRGMKESVVHDCNFIKVGANRTATVQIDNRGGSNSIIGSNNRLSDSYNNAGGYYAGTNEDWVGNWNIAGVTGANPTA